MLTSFDADRKLVVSRQSLMYDSTPIKQTIINDYNSVRALRLFINSLEHIPEFLMTFITIDIENIVGKRENDCIVNSIFSYSINVCCL